VVVDQTTTIITTITVIVVSDNTLLAIVVSHVLVLLGMAITRLRILVTGIVIAGTINQAIHVYLIILTTTRRVV